ncbi:hypothetical protein [Parabacteroides sp. AM08-6]|uniref:hypothetical protein n=1 Tax=Parabacteroides sp. AM08-6 TaxID=2292053 RepID=UPI000F00807B|nr:hypothetical protein [Parabacteroides sp. AM08-6]RHJ82414.1 hypothetical protein DW103_09650 [Parabacteroides sp. AM08-6]
MNGIDGVKCLDYQCYTDKYIRRMREIRTRTATTDTATFQDMPSYSGTTATRFNRLFIDAEWILPNSFIFSN